MLLPVETNMREAGYRHPAYAKSLAEFGTPHLLPRSGGFVLKRPIPELRYRDAMGCYPLFACAYWVGLEADLEDLAQDLVSIALVADPFGNYNPDDLRRWFPHKCIPFKDHFVADLRTGPSEFVSKHHRYYARRAVQAVSVERCERPGAFVDDWVALYQGVIDRFGLKAIKAFSRSAFAQQLEIPGMEMLRAVHDGKTVGGHLWYRQDNVIYSHLAATTALGYELMAPYALHWVALEMFAGTADWVDFGGGAGVGDQQADGLTQFKRGWSTGTRTAYFCGRIFNERRYREALAARDMADNDYFPAYRKGELG